MPIYLILNLLLAFLVTLNKKRPTDEGWPRLIRGGLFGEVRGEVNIAGVADIEVIDRGDGGHGINPIDLDHPGLGSGITSPVDHPIGKGEDEVPIGREIAPPGQ